MFGYIYLILNKVNGKTYIGKHVSNNWQDNYMGSGKLIKLAQKKYGIDNFEKFLIQTCNSPIDLMNAEIFWIKEYRSRNKAEYNIADGGDGVTINGRPWNYHKKLGHSWNYGKSGYHVHSDSWIEYLREIHKGKSINPNSKEAKSDEHKSKIRDSNRKFWSNNKNYAKSRAKKSHETYKARYGNVQLSPGSRGMHWYNNGEINTLAFECPDGFVKGRLRHV